MLCNGLIFSKLVMSGAIVVMLNVRPNLVSFRKITCLNLPYPAPACPILKRQYLT